MNSSAASERFLDAGKGICDFSDEFLFVCPGCSRCAEVRQIDAASAGPFSPRRFACRHCGMSRDWEGRAICRMWHAPPVDHCFHLPLWLQV